MRAPSGISKDSFGKLCRGHCGWTAHLCLLLAWLTELSDQALGLRRGWGFLLFLDQAGQGRQGRHSCGLVSWAAVKFAPT